MIYPDDVSCGHILVDIPLKTGENFIKGKLENDGPISSKKIRFRVGDGGRRLDRSPDTGRYAEPKAARVGSPK
jgi:hypothetical protein